MDKPELNIQDLPNTILEKIFLNVRDNNCLVRVCKKFRQIIRTSRKLIWNQKFKSERPDNSVYIDAFEQRLTVNSIEPKVYDFLKNYKWKEVIKSLNWNVFKEEIATSYAQFHFASIDFSILEEICIDFSSDSFRYLDKSFIIHENLSAFYKPNLSALKSLEINNYDNEDELIGLFTNAPNLKKLVLKNVYDFTSFCYAEWKLEEMELKLSSVHASALKFLKRQGRTLKVLELFSYESILNDVVRLMPNLEVLRLRQQNVDFFDDKSLKPNDKLKELSILDSKMKSRTVERLLIHYNKIERLCIDVYRKIELSFLKIILPNLQYITLSHHCCELLWHLRLANLKSITLPNKDIYVPFLLNIPRENFKNVEELKIHIDIEDIIEVFDFFPALKHFYMLNDNFVNEYALDDMLKIRDLLSIHISRWGLKDSPKEYLKKKGNNKTVIELYSEVKDILGKFEQRIIDRFEYQFLPISEPTTSFDYYDY